MTLYLSLHRAICLLLISASVFLFSCQKESNDPAPEEQEPARDYLITEMENDATRFRFSYNEKDQITKIEYWEAYGSSTELVIYQSVEYKYENGKATGYFVKFFDRFQQTWSPTSEINFMHDQQGKIIEVNYGYDVTTYEYDAEDRPIKINSSSFGEKAFNYNAEGNVIYPTIPSDNPDYPFFRSDMKYTAYGNPLLKNGTSLLFYIAFRDMAGRPTELFSACLPEKYETISLLPQPPLPSGENNDYKASNLSEYSYTFDKDGLLTSKTEKYKNLRFFGNKLTVDDNGEVISKVISIKK